VTIAEEAAYAAAKRIRSSRVLKWKWNEYHEEPAFGGDKRMKMNEYHEYMRSLPSAGTI